MKFRYDLQEPSFTVRSIDIQNVTRSKNYRHFVRQGRIKHGFIYTVRGKMRNTFSYGERKTIDVGAGELIFIPKGCVYTGTYMEEGTEIKIVQFEIAEGELPEYLASPVKLELPNAGELMEAFFVPTEHHTHNHPFYHFSCLYNLLWQIDENYARIPKKYKKLQAAFLEIVEHWDRNETVAYYASLCDMSEANFRRLFREYTGKSPIEYRNELRLVNAQSKLRSGEYNVSEAATLCGFSNLSFFIRLYKKKFGYTPKKE
ncbi:MAG: helix-turn-helix transcriptional regulator [Ruminococcaceae bacterium]|nr:helix-turn-helix transcriptional regulator [Oscillospiraceae bacterium]